MSEIITEVHTTSPYLSGSMTDVLFHLTRAT